jgi:hypothetical protein
MRMHPAIRVLFHLVIIVPVGSIVYLLAREVYEGRVAAGVIQNLAQEGRMAEITVLKSEMGPAGKVLTTVAFHEYHVNGKKLPARYLTFPGGTLNVQSLVFRFNDPVPRFEENLKGESAYIFLKVFAFEGMRLIVLTIADVHEVPEGYKTMGGGAYEKDLWREIWNYGLNPDRRREGMMQSAQIVAGSGFFVPGTGFTLRLTQGDRLEIEGPYNARARAA